ncbi:hypothetical protein JHK87_047407 [Glycine soja]|nr:hypothetical protein JHK87_047407 [Glycine soja]
MATNILQAKWNHHSEEDEDHKDNEQQEEEEEEEEDEALSLCDLPINLEDPPGNQEHSRPNETSQEEFNFRLWRAPFNKEPEMCAADEVFFKGQILPLRVSFSSEAGLLATVSQSQQHYGKQFVRSESLDRNSSDYRSSSNSSRSSSLRSQNSSTSTSTSSTTTNTTIPKSKHKIRNQFHTHPSPKPQLRASAPTHNQGRKSTSAWGIFRLGVVPAPEIGLQDLKVRNRNCVVVSRNSSNSNSNNNNNSSKSVKTSNRNNKKGSSNYNNVLKQLVGKGGGLLSGCDCSFETVQPNNIVMIKGGNGNGNSGGGTAKSTNMTESTTHAAKEKVVEFKKHKQQKQGKKVTSRRRTFEWIKELHASQPDDEEALLSNAS